MSSAQVIRRMREKLDSHNTLLVFFHEMQCDQALPTCTTSRAKGSNLCCLKAYYHCTYIYYPVNGVISAS